MLNLILVPREILQVDAFHRIGLVAPRISAKGDSDRLPGADLRLEHIIIDGANLTPPKHLRDEQKSSAVLGLFH
jgi:hypothetical protein